MREELSQTRLITIYYAYFQGLRSVVIGVYIAVSMLPKQGDLTIPCTLLPVAILAYLGVDYYYTRTYGRVKPKTGGRLQLLLIVLGLGVLAYLAFGLDTRGLLPVSAGGLLLAAIHLAGFVRTSEVQGKAALTLFPEVFISGVVMAIASLLPLTGFIWWQAVGLQSLVAAIEFVYGILLTLSGLWSHFRLARVLGHRREGADGITL